MFTLPAAQTFAATNWTFFTISGIFSPVSGFSRTQWTYEVSTASSFYSGKFGVAYYAAATSTWTASSFNNLNGAFYGFNAVSGYQRLSVNAGNPIEVTVGTVAGPFAITAPGSFLSISTSLTATAPSALTLSDTSFSLDYLSPTDEFYIGVPATAPFGTYVISWAITDTPAGSQTKPNYLRPRPTLVTVDAKTIYDISFSPSTINVTPGYQSLPVLALITQWKTVGPFTSVKVSFVAANPNITATFNPSTVEITSEMMGAYFTVNCSNCVSGTTYLVNVTVGGDDAVAFKAPSQISFIYQAQYTAAAKVTGSVSAATSTGFNYSLTSDSAAINTWILSSSSDAQDYTTVSGMVDSLTDPSSTNPSYLEQLVAWALTVYDIVSNTNYDYDAIIQELYIQGAGLTFCDQEIVSVGANSIAQFVLLLPSTTYYVTSWTDNLSGQSFNADTQNATTAALPSHAQLAITGSTLTAAQIQSALAVALKWDATYISVSTSRSRQLGSASAFIYADPSNSANPYTVANSALAAVGTAVGGTVTATQISAANFTSGSFSDSLWITDNGVVLTLNFTAAVDGRLYCTVENGTNETLSTSEVYLGIDATYGGSLVWYWEYVTGSAATNYSINFTDQGYNTSTYSVNCILCNSYPGTPSCSDPISTNYVFTNTSSNSAGQMLMVAIAAYLFL